MLFVEIPGGISINNRKKLRKQLRKKYKTLDIIFEPKEAHNRIVAIIESKEKLSEEEKVPVAKFIDDLIVELK